MHIKLHCLCLNQNVKKSKTKTNQFNHSAVNFVIVLVLVFECAFFIKLYTSENHIPLPSPLSLFLSSKCYQYNQYLNYTSLIMVYAFVHVLKHIYTGVIDERLSNYNDHYTDVSTQFIFSYPSFFFRAVLIVLFVCLLKNCLNRMSLLCEAATVTMSSLLQPSYATTIQ